MDEEHEDDEWLELEKVDQPKKLEEQEEDPKPFYMNSIKDDFQDFTVKEIIDENFEPKTFGVKPHDLPGALTPICPNLTLQQIETINERDSPYFFKIKNICSVKYDNKKRITGGFIQSETIPQNFVTVQSLIEGSESSQMHESSIQFLILAILDFIEAHDVRHLDPAAIYFDQS